jgi:hypothetical protein
LRRASGARDLSAELCGHEGNGYRVGFGEAWGTILPAKDFS